MKRISILIVAVFMAMQFAGCKKEGPSVVQNDGVVNFITGDVKVVADGQTVALNAGDKVTQGMTVKTGVKSIVDIYFQGSVIRILEKSSVVMTELAKNIAENKELTELYIENGKVFSKVTKKLTDGDKFRVNTPTAVAGVRGTEFLVSEENGKSTISCIEGKVVVRDSGADDTAFVEVEAGKEANVEQGKPVTVAELKQKNLDDIRRIKDEIKELREDIRRKFEEQRDEIKQKVADQKDANKARVEDQKATDKANIEAIKASNTAQKEAIKTDMEDKKAESKEAVTQFNKPDVSGAKPEIKKFKADLKNE
jgi:hypothetical protein